MKLLGRIKPLLIFLKLRILIIPVHVSSENIGFKIYFQKGNSPDCLFRPSNFIKCSKYQIFFKF